MSKKICIYYDSITGNVKRFVEKVSRYGDFEIKKIDEKTILENEAHFITFTTGIGEISAKTKKFLNNNFNYKKIKTLAVSGNMNWGLNYGLAGDKISKEYEIPLIMKFELSGTIKDVEKYLEKIKERELII